MNGVGTLRLRLDFAYDGTDFSGWAKQPGRRSVEGELERALGVVLRHPVRLVVAGRTDAGVHARGAVAHVDADPEAYARLPGRSARIPGEAAVTRLGGVLPGDIVVRRVQPAPEGFDARFSALSRRYSYTLCDRPAELDPLRRREVAVSRRPLDAAAMDQAAAALVGLADFAAFCKRREGATTIRTLLRFGWQRQGPLVVGTVCADAFCHSMVRALAGAMVPVGEGRKPADWPRQVLLGGRRDPAVTVMPPQGLCLEEVTYPPPGQLAERARQARAVRELPGSPEAGGGALGEPGGCE